uniref:Uncharacterized protein n=1 Tax=Cannabis sativa TaxID=3483 RepID=A0A803QY53_CANSA
MDSNLKTKLNLPSNYPHRAICNFKKLILYTCVGCCLFDFSLCLFPAPVICTPPPWSPPPDDWVKINCDVNVGSDLMCVMALARDHKESILWVASNILNFSDLSLEKLQLVY